MKFIEAKLFEEQERDMCCNLKNISNTYMRKTLTEHVLKRDTFQSPVYND